MIDAEGNPRTLEFNCRMGDPETQPIMARLKSDYLTVLEHACNGTLDAVDVKFSRALMPMAGGELAVAIGGEARRDLGAERLVQDLDRREGGEALARRVGQFGRGHRPRRCLDADNVDLARGISVPEIDLEDEEVTFDSVGIDLLAGVFVGDY